MNLPHGCSHSSISIKHIAIFTTCKRKRKDKLKVHKSIMEYHVAIKLKKIEKNILNMQTFAHTFTYIYFYIHTQIPEGYTRNH